MWTVNYLKRFKLQSIWGPFTHGLIYCVPLISRILLWTEVKLGFGEVAEMLVRPTPHSVSPCLPCSIFTRDTNVVLNLSFYGITGSSGLLKEGVQCMLVKFMARKEAWLKFTEIVPHPRLPDAAAYWSVRQNWRLLISIDFISSTKQMNLITRKSVSKLVTQPSFRKVGQTCGIADI